MTIGIRLQWAHMLESLVSSQAYGGIGKEVWVLFKIPGSRIFLVLANDRRKSRMKVPIVGTLHK